jgi:hypothetical protein
MRAEVTRTVNVTPQAPGVITPGACESALAERPGRYAFQTALALT